MYDFHHDLLLDVYDFRWVFNEAFRQYGKKMQPDFESVIERKIHAWFNYMEGVMHTGQRNLLRVRVSNDAFDKGLRMKDFLQIIIEQATVPVVVDAGIGAPSHAAEAMEMGASACLVNTAIAVAGNPVEMAKAFKEAVVCGRRAYEAGLGAVSDCAEASSPLTQFLM